MDRAGRNRGDQPTPAAAGTLDAADPGAADDASAEPTKPRDTPGIRD